MLALYRHKGLERPEKRSSLLRAVYLCQTLCLFKAHTTGRHRPIVKAVPPHSELVFRRRRCSRLPLVKVVPSNPTAMSTPDPDRSPDPLGELQAYSSQDQPDAPQSAGTSPSGEDADHGLLVLRKIFDEGHSTEDLPKGFFYLDRDEIDEEAAEVSTSEFLKHYHTIADHLERGLGTAKCALSPEAWLRLHGDLLAWIIHGLNVTHAEGISDAMVINATPSGENLLQTMRDNAMTVATALTHYPLQLQQCDTCLRSVKQPIVSEDEYTAFIHATDRSRQALHDFLWERTLVRVNKEINSAYDTEITKRHAHMERELQEEGAKFRAAREAEIINRTEQDLGKFSDNYYNSRRQAMIDSIDLSIRREKENLLHQRRAELLPLSTSIALNDARQALDEGLAESSTTPRVSQRTQPTNPSQLLPGEDRLDSVIANLTDTLITKINDLAVNSNAKFDKLAAELDFRLSRIECKDKKKDAVAASGGGFTTARQIAYIHECATDNVADHQISQHNSPNVRIHEAEQQTQAEDMQTGEDFGNAMATTHVEAVSDPFAQTDADMQFSDPAPIAPQETAETQRHLDQPPNAIHPPPANNGEQAIVCLPNTRPPTNRTTHPPKPSYAATAAAQNSWQTVPPRRGKGKHTGSHTNQQSTTKPNQPTTTNNDPKTQKPTPRPETLRTEITVQRPPGSVVTNLSDASLICRRVVAALRAAKSDLPLLSGRWATHTHNYVYTFAGNIPFTKITQIAHILLQPFPNGVLAPCAGWSRVIFHGTPVSDPDSDAMYTNEQLLEEVVRNPICAKLHFVLTPAWVRRPEHITSDTSSISFAFIDKDGTITQTMKKAHLAMFGKPVTFAKWVSRPPLTQCS